MAEPMAGASNVRCDKTVHGKASDGGAGLNQKLRLL
jgi:hypothetical protein